MTFFRHLHIYCQVILCCLHFRLFPRAKKYYRKNGHNAQWFHSSWSILLKRVNIPGSWFPSCFFSEKIHPFFEFRFFSISAPNSVRKMRHRCSIQTIFSPSGLTPGTAQHAMRNLAIPTSSWSAGNSQRGLTWTSPCSWRTWSLTSSQRLLKYSSLSTMPKWQKSSS